MDNNTTLMGCIICLLVFNLFIVLYNENPISEQLQGTNFSVQGMEEGINESGVTEQSSGLSVVIGIGKFILNLFVLAFGWYPSYSFIVNAMLKIFSYIFIIPIILITYDKIRGI